MAYTIDYSGLPRPDYNKRGMEGHQPLSDAERKQGWTRRAWMKRVIRLRCSFCPYDCGDMEAAMQLHVYQMHYMKNQLNAGPEAQAILENFQAAAEKEAQMHGGSGVQVETLNAPVPMRKAAPAAPVQSLLETEIPVKGTDEALLSAMVADMRRKGEIVDDGTNEDQPTTDSGSV